jgi:catechol 2,3-dioxygenase-like lactoylglutathione lyase family enzyme
MLATKDTQATVAVRDVKAARKFYEGILGLKPAEGADGDPPVYQTGNSRMLVYESQYAGTNTATSVTWDVGRDVERVVEWLKGRGVAFEHYDLPGATLQGDVHLIGPGKAAWFKDPEGNIHALIGR